MKFPVEQVQVFLLLKNPEHSIITITDGGKKTDVIYFIGYFYEVF